MWRSSSRLPSNWGDTTCTSKLVPHLRTCGHGVSLEVVPALFQLSMVGQCRRGLPGAGTAVYVADASPQPRLGCNASRRARSHAPRNVLHLHVGGRQLAAQACLHVAGAHAHGGGRKEPARLGSVQRNQQFLLTAHSGCPCAAAVAVCRRRVVSGSMAAASCGTKWQWLRKLTLCGITQWLVKTPLWQQPAQWRQRRRRAATASKFQEEQTPDRQ